MKCVICGREFEEKNGYCPNCIAPAIFNENAKEDIEKYFDDLGESFDLNVTGDDLIERVKDAIDFIIDNIEAYEKEDIDELVCLLLDFIYNKIRDGNKEFIAVLACNAPLFIPQDMLDSKIYWTKRAIEEGFDLYIEYACLLLKKEDASLIDEIVETINKGLERDSSIENKVYAAMLLLQTPTKEKEGYEKIKELAYDERCVGQAYIYSLNALLAYYDGFDDEIEPDELKNKLLLLDEPLSDIVRPLTSLGILYSEKEKYDVALELLSIASHDEDEGIDARRILAKMFYDGMFVEEDKNFARDLYLISEEPVLSSRVTTDKLDSFLFKWIESSSSRSEDERMADFERGYDRFSDFLIDKFRIDLDTEDLIINLNKNSDDYERSKEIFKKAFQQKDKYINYFLIDYIFVTPFDEVDEADFTIEEYDFLSFVAFKFEYFMDSNIQA